jgi:hypothetical protein
MSAHEELETIDILPHDDSEEEPQCGLGLVLVWYPADPERAGEWIPIGGPGNPTDLMFGRGDDGSARRARLFRRRPGSNVARPPLTDRRLSRNQLSISVRGPNKLFVRSTGRVSLRVDSRVCEEAEVGIGSRIALGRVMLFQVAERLLHMPLEEDQQLHPFGRPDPDGIVGESDAAWELRDTIRMVAPRGRHVLILGESGTGKELVARAIHRQSGRGQKELVSRNAATLPDSLIDAEIFGNARNYPNPGMPERPGLVGQADGSSLFLDEVGELPEAMQAHLLRVMDAGEYQRLGDASSRTADVRIIAATNRDPTKLKHDFLARFTLRIQVPALRERRDDIPLVAMHLLRQIAQEDDTIRDRLFELTSSGTVVPRVSVSLMDALLQHPFETNVRELDQLLWDTLLADPPPIACGSRTC